MQMVRPTASTIGQRLFLFTLRPKNENMIQQFLEVYVGPPA